MHQAFEAEVRERPDDDAPRLVYADWLEDNGDPERAEFIRVQIELARIGELDDRAPDLLRRQRELLVRHRDSWSKAGRKFTRRVEFERGFVGKMTLAAEKFLREAERVFAACPLRDLRLLQLDDMNAVAGSEHLARLRRLDLRDLRLGVGRVRTLATSPHLGGLEELDLSHNRMRATGAHAVFTSRRLGALRKLHLGGFYEGELSLDAFADLAALPSLTAVSLSASNLTPLDAEVLAESDRLTSLEELDLSDNEIRDEGVRWLVESGRLGRLRTLDLSSNNLTGEAMTALASCRQLTRLTELRIGRQWGAPNIADLARSPHLANLRRLTLEHSEHLDDEDARALAEATFLPRLRDLRLPRLSPKGLRAVLNAPGLAGLHRLSVTADHDHDGRAAMELAAATHLTRLTHLDLSFCRPDVEGLERLVERPLVAGLIELDLSFNRLDYRAYRALVESPYLPAYCAVNLRGNDAPSPELHSAMQGRFAEVVWA
jgi:uncharacterized protein (TIGR02996 family)